LRKGGFVIGDKEIEAAQVNVRLRDGTIGGALGVDAFIAVVQAEANQWSTNEL
jgi:threonyl-tRNA synthetase